MDTKVFEALSAPVTKLIECVSKGIGVLYKPTQIKKEGQASAEVFKIQLEVIETALTKSPEVAAIALSTLGGKLELAEIERLAERAHARISYQNTKEQENLEAIVGESIKYLGSTVAEEEVDPDWRTRFFNKAKDVSNEEMQEVWSKILAGEVTKPGSFSLRAIELLSLMSQSEAELFRKMSSYVFDHGHAIISHGTIQTKGFNSELNFVNILRLQDAGILMTKEGLALNQEFPPNGFIPLSFAHGKLILRNSSKEKKVVRLNVLTLTTAAKELMSLLDAPKWTDDYEKQIEICYPGIKTNFFPK